MAKKGKRKHSMPALSRLDKAVYVVLMLLVIFLLLGMLVPFFLLLETVAFSDPTAIAFSSHMSVLWAMPLFLVVLLVLFVPLETARAQKQPIFGRRDVVYGPPRWEERYPLWMRNRPKVYRRPAERNARRVTALFAAAALLVSLLLFPLACFGRDVLHADGGLSVRNAWNTERERYDAHEVESVLLSVRRERTRRYSASGWTLQAEVRTADGKQYSFDYGDFAGGGMQSLEAMCAWKACFPARTFAYENAESLSLFAKDKGLDAAETETLYSLFDIKVPGA